MFQQQSCCWFCCSGQRDVEERAGVKQLMNSKGLHPHPQFPLLNLAPARSRQEDLALPVSCGQSGHGIASPGIGVCRDNTGSSSAACLDVAPSQLTGTFGFSGCGTGSRAGFSWLSQVQRHREHPHVVLPSLRCPARWAVLWDWCLCMEKVL